MSESYDLLKKWEEIDSALRRITARFEAHKDPTDRVFSEAAEADRLASAKEAFEEERHQFRLAVIRQRLKIEKRDFWLRPNAYFWMGLTKH